MALSHSTVWNRCWSHTYQLTKYVKLHNVLKHSLLKENFHTLQIRQDTFITWSRYIPPSADRLPRGSLARHSFKSVSCSHQRKHFSSSSVVLQNKAAGLMSKMFEDIDLKELKEQVIQERKETKHPGLHLHTRIKELVAKKSDELIANLAPEEEKKLKVIKLEHNFLFSEGNRIPSPEEMTSQNWLQALKLPTTGQRLKYYIFVSKKNFLKKKKSQKNAEKEENQETNTKVEKYEHGRIVMRIYESTIRRGMDYRLATAMQFGIPFVIDMDYTEHMRIQEINNTARQLQGAYVLNRADVKLPYHLYFTSCSEDNHIFRLVQMYMEEKMDLLATVTEKSYLELFDKDSLVYLSPNGREVLKEFDPNTVYIMGAYNDKATQKPLSYARAKEQRIRCQRLPLDHYLKWQIGSKNLTLDQIMKIMLSLKNGEPWSEALKSVPHRKLKVHQALDNFISTITEKNH